MGLCQEVECGSYASTLVAFKRVCLTARTRTSLRYGVR